MSQSSFLGKLNSWARWCADSWARSERRTKSSGRIGWGRTRVLLQLMPLEDRTLLSNVLNHLGQDLNETQLTPANVSTSTFGKIFTTTLDGSGVDAQRHFTFPGLTFRGKARIM